jgi:hypothetical protein
MSGKLSHALLGLYPQSFAWKFLPGLGHCSQSLSFGLRTCLSSMSLLSIVLIAYRWTSFPHLSYWAPMLSGLLMGYSIQLIFLGLFNYIVDAYLPVAASALAANTVVRSLFGAGFPLFGPNLYDALGPQWAASLVGFVSLLLIPIPFVLQRYGPTLRRRSRFSMSSDEETEAPSQIPELEKA